MTMCDVRQMHADDVQPTWDFIKSKLLSKIDVTQDDGRWFMEIKGTNWRASLNAGCFDFESTDQETYPLTKHSFAYLDFYPPNGGNIRFDVCVNVKQHPVIMAEIAQMLIKHGGAGKNRVQYFIGGTEKPAPPAPEREGPFEWILRGVGR
jgi:hypothetical protein